jgi:hypothetical protein
MECSGSTCSCSAASQIEHGLGGCQCRIADGLPIPEGRSRPLRTRPVLVPPGLLLVVLAALSVVMVGGGVEWLVDVLCDCCKVQLRPHEFEGITIYKLKQTGPRVQTSLQ